MRKQQLDMLKVIEAQIKETSAETGISHLSYPVMQALIEVPREQFVKEGYQEEAYENYPLPIGESQTISQPFIVALMTESLKIQPEDRVLELGTGSGYQTAILSLLAKEVFTIEYFPSLAREAAIILPQKGYNNVHVRCGNGALGWEEEAPFDKIIVTAGAHTIPQILCDQLKKGGKMVIPIGAPNEQVLTLIQKDEHNQLESQSLLPVRFVPLQK